MVDEQERMLKQYYEPAAIAERRVSEQRLDAALRNGLIQGKKARKQRQLSKVAFASAAAILLLAGAAVYAPDSLFGDRSGAGAVHTANSRIPAYVNQLAGDKGLLREALDQGKYQSVGKTAAYEGYLVTVDGILTDRKHLVLFYTSKSEYGGRIIPDPDGTGLFDASYDKLKFKRFIHEPSKLNGIYDGKEYHDILVYDLSGSEKLPDEFYFAGKWYNGESTGDRKFLEVKVPVDTNRLAELERRVNLDKTLDFEGQKLKVTSVVQVPQRLYVNVALDPSNTKQISALSDWSLYTKNDAKDQFLNLEDLNLEEGEWGIGYYAPDYVQGDLLELHGNMVETKFEGSMKLVVDTKKKKIVSAPDGRIQLPSVNEENGYLRITSAFQRMDPLVNQNMRVEHTFTDGKGMKHTLPDDGQSIHEGWRSNGAMGRDEYYFDIENRSYPQPLTFELTEYPGEILKNPFSITLQK
ncbi:DUF4179 domain-containing protein [Paenibacillus chibensis]|uniref:DUF4179 domain-containing protein n=1 Tax=Paenibacillus chibensis TaxID=59846 RepID=UPI0013E3F94D|nr:DUF4179 domain-containing protein [Paenibacillus chibensis]MEC0372896.1 DUF4179 domain-containing protein [Paenibacillus chibensis]